MRAALIAVLAIGGLAVVAVIVVLAAIVRGEVLVDRGRS